MFDSLPWIAALPPALPRISRRNTLRTGLGAIG